VLTALAASVAIGLLNGILIAAGQLNPFIVTLGVNFLFTGIAYVITDGNSQLISDSSFSSIGQSHVLGRVPTSTLIMLGTFALAFFLLRFTKLGLHVFAVGGGEHAARLSGVRVRSVKIWIYVLSAAAAGLAGIVQASAGGSVAPYAASNSNDLLTILAAVIIGGTALTGGRGSVFGTLVGILLVGVIGNGLVLKNISSFYQPVVTGAILLIAIVLDETRRRVQPAR
jgi:ribose transport system permease protein